MNILFVSPSYKPAYIYGGPTVSVSELAEALITFGHSVTVYTTTANGKEELATETGTPIDVNGVHVYYFKRQTGDHTHLSVGLWYKLWTTVRNYDVVHLQSWWSFLVFGAASICRIKGRKYIVSPRGMLSQYSFTVQHSFPKKVLHRLFGKRLLAKSYLHATSSLEWSDCYRVNPAWKGFILPNLVRFPHPFKDKAPRQTKDLLVLGFLSRIDPKKGLEFFLQALSEVDFPFVLKIAGKGEEAYLLSLKRIIAALKLEQSVEWCGWKEGEEKFRFLRTIDVFALPSYNENFANSVIESLSVGTPVFVSKHVGLADYVEAKQLGWICDTTVPSIVQGLKEIATHPEKIQQIRHTAPFLIEQDFSKTALAKKYSEAYETYHN